MKRNAEIGLFTKPSILNEKVKYPERMKLTRDEIKSALLRLFEEEFEIPDPNFDGDLREEYGFDSIDAIELLREIEILLDTELDRDEKESAMTIRTINQIVDYIELLIKTKNS